MSNSIACDDPSGVVIAGVDTHKHKHVAVAINGLGARLSTFQAPANQAGYAEMVNWARTLGPVEAFGIEGTGSYGVGLASFVRRQGFRVVEVSHGDRRKRRSKGKNDTLDAESAARSVLAGVATAIPKVADGAAEIVRQTKVVRDTAIKARSAAMITLKTLLVNAPWTIPRHWNRSPTGYSSTAALLSGRETSSIQEHPSSTPCGRSLRVGARCRPRSVTTTRCSTTSPRRLRRPCAGRSGSVLTQRPK